MHIGDAWTALQVVCPASDKSKRPYLDDQVPKFPRWPSSTSASTT
jgi:hypothetical protein